MSAKTKLPQNENSKNKPLSANKSQSFIAKAVLEGITTQSHVKITKCPLPEPEILEKYNAVNPDIVPLLLKMLEKEQQMAEFRQAEEFKIKAKAINSVNFGRVIGLIGLLSLIALAAWSLYLNNSWIARFLVSGLSVIVVLATLGVYKYNKKMDIEKVKDKAPLS